MTTGKVDPRYGDASVAAPPWEDIERLLTNAQLYWIISVRGDGRPHAVPLVGVWHNGAFAFCTGSEEQKQRNLDANAHVAVTTGSTGARGWGSGKDVVVEGTAVRVTEAGALQTLAAAWFAKGCTPMRRTSHPGVPVRTPPAPCAVHTRGAKSAVGVRRPRQKWAVERAPKQPAQFAPQRPPRPGARYS